MSNDENPNLSKELLTLAKEMTADIHSGGYSLESFEKLCSLVESDYPPTDFDYFAVSIGDVAKWQFIDSELSAYFEIKKTQITNELRIQYIREVLVTAIENPSEDTSSAHWEEIAVSPTENLYCCALVHLEGHSPITNWYGAYLSLDDFYNELKNSGYLLSESDLDSLSDKHLLSYWTSAN